MYKKRKHQQKSLPLAQPYAEDLLYDNPMYNSAPLHHFEPESSIEKPPLDDGVYSTLTSVLESSVKKEPINNDGSCDAPSDYETMLSAAGNDEDHYETIQPSAGDDEDHYETMQPITWNKVQLAK